MPAKAPGIGSGMAVAQHRGGRPTAEANELLELPLELPPGCAAALLQMQIPTKWKGALARGAAALRSGGERLLERGRAFAAARVDALKAAAAERRSKASSGGSVFRGGADDDRCTMRDSLLLGSVASQHGGAAAAPAAALPLTYSPLASGLAASRVLRAARAAAAAASLSGATPPASDAGAAVQQPVAAAQQQHQQQHPEEQPKQQEHKSSSTSSSTSSGHSSPGSKQPRLSSLSRKQRTRVAPLPAAAASGPATAFEASGAVGSRASSGGGVLAFEPAGFAGPLQTAQPQRPRRARVPLEQQPLLQPQQEQQQQQPQQEQQSSAPAVAAAPAAPAPAAAAAAAAAAATPSPVASAHSPPLQAAGAKAPPRLGPGSVAAPAIANGSSSLSASAAHHRRALSQDEMPLCQLAAAAAAAGPARAAARRAGRDAQWAQRLNGLRAAGAKHVIKQQGGAGAPPQQQKKGHVHEQQQKQDDDIELTNGSNKAPLPAVEDDAPLQAASAGKLSRGPSPAAVAEQSSDSSVVAPLPLPLVGGGGAAAATARSSSCGSDRLSWPRASWCAPLPNACSSVAAPPKAEMQQQPWQQPPGYQEQRPSENESDRVVEANGGGSEAWRRSSGDDTICRIASLGPSAAGSFLRSSKSQRALLDQLLAAAGVADGSNLTASQQVLAARLAPLQAAAAKSRAQTPGGRRGGASGASADDGEDDGDAALLDWLPTMNSDICLMGDVAGCE